MVELHDACFRGLNNYLTVFCLSVTTFFFGVFLGVDYDMEVQTLVLGGAEESARTTVSEAGYAPLNIATQG